METPLGGKVALVTGASSGIGRALARRLEVVRAAIGAGDTLVLPTDLSRAEEVDRMVAATLDRFGRIRDVVILPQNQDI